MDKYIIYPPEGYVFNKCCECGNPCLCEIQFKDKEDHKCTWCELKLGEIHE